MRAKRLPFSGKTPRSLIQRLSDDRPDDWATFCGIYAPLIHKLTGRYSLQESDADEVTAAVIKGLMQRFRTGFRIRTSKGWFRNYVATATQNAVIAHRKRQKRDHASSLDDHKLDSASLAPPDDLARLELHAQVRFCLDQLRNSPKTRRRNFLAFERYVINGEPAKDVAKAYGLKVQRLYEIKREMLARLETMLRDLGIDVREDLTCF